MLEMKCGQFCCFGIEDIVLDLRCMAVICSVSRLGDMFKNDIEKLVRIFPGQTQLADSGEQEF